METICVTLCGVMIGCLFVCCQIAGSSSWHARYTVLTYLQIMVFYNLFTFMSDQRAVGDVRALVIKLLEDEQLEVNGRETAPRRPLGVAGGGRFRDGPTSLCLFSTRTPGSPVAPRSPPAPLAVAMETPGCSYLLLWR